ncbi:choice-of-anchor I family protein [Fibrella forsythiae]|uniref:Choice-of-anchor I family protein n=1 Tax=Fibrella forsythiae TaxID=2817061 RepID=A0ABS3JFN8_9BACT|nr:choice-of-anchor I family protein [Fibrella forsythiae]MBO0948819.1 choice-of-anchor I family protein [Fibrella forsythiae]
MHTSRYLLAGSFAILCLVSCDHRDAGLDPRTENTSVFREIATLDLGGTAASEISAYDPLSQRIFTVNNETVPKVEVLEYSTANGLVKRAPIDVSALGGVANSVAVSNGKLAIALEATNKQANGSVVVVDTRTLAIQKTIPVGALPDMVTYSPDGRYIVTADEGEPNDAYTVDPVGSVSIIDITNNYSVKTLTFEAFDSQKATLMANGFRLFGPKASLAQDVEPEYVTISPDSRKAWVTLQESNAIAEVDLVSGAILRLWPLGTKDVSLTINAIDPSDRDNKIALATWPIKTFYLPDAIAHFEANGGNYLITADEGDTRAYGGYNEEARISTLTLDPVAFPNGTMLKDPANLGRMVVTKSLGDTDGDGDYDVLYGFGGRGFSIINAATGQRSYFSGKTLEEKVIAAGLYDDTRSDDKGVEPEGVTVGTINGRPIAFIALERADAIAIYDLSDPANPQFRQLLPTGDAPEGVHFVAAGKSPTGRSLLIVSSEGDGTVKVYQPDFL